MRALAGVSFHVERGETAALLGENGSGKSTLIRCVVGFFSPTAGCVRVNGRDITDGGPSARRVIGYVPEQVAIYPELSVARYLAFVAHVKGLGRTGARRAVGEAIERCGLGEVRHRPAGVLSRGFRQRVGIAQALLAEPAVLVLDEPTVGLDPVQVVEIRGLIRSFSDRTILLSTHLLAEASQLCDRVIVLRRGRVVAEDTPAGLSARVGGGSRLVLRVEGPAEAVEAALRAAIGDADVELERGAGSVRCVVRGGDPGALQRAIVPRIAAGGWTLREIREETPTLEDLFVRLVR